MSERLKEDENGIYRRRRRNYGKEVTIHCDGSPGRLRGRSGFFDKRCGKRLTLETDYTGLGKIQYRIAQEGLTVLDTTYTDHVEIQLVVPMEQCGHFECEIIEATGKTAGIVWGEEVYYAVVANNIKIFEKNT